MSRCWPMLLVVASSLFVGSRAVATPEPAAEPGPEFTPTASIQDVMLSLIDPSADAIWDSVATIITADGIEDRRPSTDEDWAELRHHAIHLVEAPNLLLMEGRPVARPGFKSEFPGIELEPEEIEALVTEDPATWREYTRDLHDVGVILLNAVEARDVDALFNGGETLDQACEACHQHYWYPGF